MCSTYLAIKKIETKLQFFYIQDAVDTYCVLIAETNKILLAVLRKSA